MNNTILKVNIIVQQSVFLMDKNTKYTKIYASRLKEEKKVCKTEN